MSVTFIRSDLEFILQQILISEAHAAGADLTTLIPNAFIPWGLRTVDGSFNNLAAGNENFGAADELFPRLVDPVYRNDQDGDSIALGPPPAPVVTNTDYGASGDVVDADPRIISNLIVDQTSSNPAAVAVAGSAGADNVWGTPDDQLNDGVSIIKVTAGLDGIAGNTDDIAQFSFENVSPDEGLSAPFNQWFVFFGQFFDHGLDLVQKGGIGFVFIPLQADDPLVTLGPDGVGNSGDEAAPGQQFMILTRATTYAGPGADGILADDPNTAADESAGPITSGGGAIQWPTTRSKSGVNATSAWRPVKPSPACSMKRRPTAYDARSRASAVEAASSMMIGASRRSASGNTTPP